jgi:hypothetical protein
MRGLFLLITIALGLGSEVQKEKRRQCEVRLRVMKRYLDQLNEDENDDDDDNRCSYSKAVGYESVQDAHGVLLRRQKTSPSISAEVLFDLFETRIESAFNNLLKSEVIEELEALIEREERNKAQLVVSKEVEEEIKRESMETSTTSTKRPIQGPPKQTFVDQRDKISEMANQLMFMRGRHNYMKKAAKKDVFVKEIKDLTSQLESIPAVPREVSKIA